MTIGTLCFLVTDTHILLAMKKRGFGAGKWNGLGGKVRDGETVEAAAVREVREEAGVTVEPQDLERVAGFTFLFAGEPKWYAHVFFVRRWGGEALESDEMRPQWFDRNAIPYDTMWVDDREWLPLVLAGKRLEGEFWLNTSGEVLENFTLQEAAFQA